MTTQINPEILDQDALMERIGGDVEFLQEITVVFLEEREKLLGEIRTAMDRADVRGLEHAAHTLKGAVANLGAGAARGAALRMETMGRAGNLDGAGAAYASLERELDRFSQTLAALSDALAVEEGPAALREGSMAPGASAETAA